MKLTGKLKETVSKAETKEQAKELIAKAGMKLTDEEMDTVAGGQSEIYCDALHDSHIGSDSAIVGQIPARIQDLYARVMHNGPLKM